MRDMKFRAWDKEKKEWAWPYPEGFSIIGEVTVFELLQQWAGGIEQFNNLVIVQYTGLKDSKGVEIFEGDIVTYNYQDTIYKSEVGWVKNICGWEPFCIPIDYDEVYILDNWTHLPIEVIGNIYESPELLNEK